MSPFISAEMVPGDNVQDGGLPDAVESALESYGHPTASAPMGHEGDQRAVVDSRCAVYGVTGLSVVDASVIPLAPSAATNLTTVMIAERISSKLRHR